MASRANSGAITIRDLPVELKGAMKRESADNRREKSGPKSYRDIVIDALYQRYADTYLAEERHREEDEARAFAEALAKGARAKSVEDALGGVL